MEFESWKIDAAKCKSSWNAGYENEAYPKRPSTPHPTPPQEDIYPQELNVKEEEEEEEENGPKGRMC